MKRISVVLAAAVVLAGCGPSSPSATPDWSSNNPSPDATPQASTTLGPIPTIDSEAPAPEETVKLIFIHHSTGENWLGDESGGLGLALADNNYFVSDTYYGWGPEDSLLGSVIGDNTDIGHWWNWFLGPSRDTIMDAVYSESGQATSYSRLADDPGGENEIVMFKSCFPNSNIEGSPNDPPTAGHNPLEGAGTDNLTVGTAKALYLDLLEYFGAHTDKLFVAITAPPEFAGNTDPGAAANARGFNSWLVEDWLDDYPHSNVAVFDFYNVLSSNGGDPYTNDLGATGGNHHRYLDGQIEYVTNQGKNTSAYAVEGDSHPTYEGNYKATGEFVPMLNLFYLRWQDGE
ncbi:MAG: hypothetical protein MUP36_00040 [Demequinaceae bacterium]|nr:hypothetical protein [Demequinaceae bacterium]